MSIDNNIPAFPNNCERGMTLLDYFAIRMPEPSREDIESEAHRDRSANPHNYPDKPALRSTKKIVADLKYEQAALMLEARKTYIP